MFHTEWTEKEDMISRFSVSSWPWFILFITYKSEMSQMRTVWSVGELNSPHCCFDHIW